MTNNYRLGHIEVEARQHSGTNQSADSLGAWIRESGTRVEIIPVGKFDYDLDNAYLRLFDRFDRLVQPHFWVVRTEDGHFYSVYPDIFKNMYKSLGDDDADVRQEESDRRSVSA